MEDIQFRGKNPDEEVVFLVRAHPFFFMKSGFIAVALLIILVVIFSQFGASSVSSWAIFIIVPIIALLIFHRWFLWSNSIYVLTNERLIAVWQKGFFSRDLAEVDVDNILTTNHTIKGLFQTFFNFGDIKIRVSGTSEEEIVLREVYDPYKLQQKILLASKHKE
ncbi:PH domain-containing protein [Candidatus Berkelbacteria bacterium]|nr:PH domain-containing protein [Candidatus Berkelbacteria bacterium]